MPAAVFARGRKTAEWKKDRMQFVGALGHGRFVKRQPFQGF
jgi:hypothetical protein